MTPDQERIQALEMEVERLKHQRSGLRTTIDTLQDTMAFKDQQIKDMAEYIRELIQ